MSHGGNLRGDCLCKRENGQVCPGEGEELRQVPESCHLADGRGRDRCPRVFGSRRRPWLHGERTLLRLSEFICEWPRRDVEKPSGEDVTSGRWPMHWRYR